MLYLLMNFAYCRVTVFQALMLDGMKKTSPAIASAMLNLAPGFIFVVAGCLRYDICCRRLVNVWRAGSECDLV